MISIEETKKLWGNPNMSDEEARKIRDDCYAFAELIVEVLCSPHMSKKIKQNRKLIKKNKFRSHDAEDEQSS